MTTRKFRITIEGEAFEVEVEEIGGFPGSKGSPLQYVAPQRAAPPPPPPPRSTSSPPPPITPPPPPPSPAVVRQPTVAAASGAVTSPMPGTILSLKVKAGDQVKAGDVLLILESMKIQNEIVAPKSGTVKEVFIRQGEYVKSKHPLVAIE